VIAAPRPARASAWLIAACVVVAGLGLVTSPSARAATLPPGFQDTTVFSGLQEPTNFRFAPDGRIFVAEKTGKILVFDSLEDETPTLFADIRTQVYDTGDRGILGLALDPKFDEGRPYVYVLYTYDHVLGEPGGAPKWGEPNHTGDGCPKPESADVDACPVSGRLVRLTAEGGGDHAVEEGGVPKEHVLIKEDWCQQFSSHSIGDLQFDSSGALYASGGDGASFGNTDYGQFGWPQPNECGDPPGTLAQVQAGTSEPLELPNAEGGALRSQDVRTPTNPLDPSADPTDLNGSIIRIDPDTGEGLPGNPMHASFEPNERRIVGYGFRNPFRFTIDPTTNELYVDNVGWNLYEEMDRFPTVPTKAYNSGWPCWEGPEFAYIGVGLTLCENLKAEEPGASSQPFFYYTHTGGVTPEDPCPTVRGSAITGITFYEGNAFPAQYHGALFFADAVRGCIYVMFPGEDGRPDPNTAVPFMTEATPYAGVDLEVGPEGDLYYISLAEGQIHRIAHFTGNQPPVARVTADHISGAAPLHVEFSAAGSTDPEGEPLEYEWDSNEDGIYTEPSTEEVTIARDFEEEEVEGRKKNPIVALRVTDAQGAQSTAKITVYPGDTPPEPQIVEPEESSPGSGKANFEWHVGQPIEFKGKATDAEDGTLEKISLGWNSRVLHCPFGPENCHFHPLQAFPGVTGGTLIAPDHDYPSRIVLTLTATDSRGLSATKTLELEPHPVQLQIESQPVGIPVTASLQTTATPFGLKVIEDSIVTLAAPASAVVGGTTYEWSGWSDGGARVHTVKAAAPATYKAIYTAVKEPPKEESPSPKEKAQPPVQAAPPPLVSPGTLLGFHPRRRTPSGTARFTFSASVAGSKFRCELDSKPFRACSSPLVFKHLKPGGHILQVAAVDPSGVVDPTPAIFKWTVLRQSRRR
jgi:glucose/arabinose dehydrogenase